MDCYKTLTINNLKTFCGTPIAAFVVTAAATLTTQLLFLLALFTYLLEAAHTTNTTKIATTNINISNKAAFTIDISA